MITQGKQTYPPNAKNLKKQPSPTHSLHMFSPPKRSTQAMFSSNPCSHQTVPTLSFFSCLQKASCLYSCFTNAHFSPYQATPPQPRRTSKHLLPQLRYILTPSSPITTPSYLHPVPPPSQNHFTATHQSPT